MRLAAGRGLIGRFGTLVFGCHLGVQGGPAAAYVDEGDVRVVSRQRHADGAQAPLDRTLQRWTAGSQDGTELLDHGQRRDGHSQRPCVGLARVAPLADDQGLGDGRGRSEQPDTREDEHEQLLAKGPAQLPHQHHRRHRQDDIHQAVDSGADAGGDHGAMWTQAACIGHAHIPDALQWDADHEGIDFVADEISYLDSSDGVQEDLPFNA